MVFLREAQLSDKDMLFKWANDPNVRRNSFNSEPIKYEDHENWFDHILDDENVIQFILMDETYPVGQIRLNLENENAEIGYSIAAEYRGKGYGRKLLQMIEKRVQSEYPRTRVLVAKVKLENMASRKLLESEGYEMKHMGIYERRIV